MTKRDKNDPAEIDRQVAITRRQEQRSARGMDANTAAFLAAWEDENDTEPVDIQIQEPTGPTAGQLIDEQRGTTPVSADSGVQFVNPSDLDTMRNRDRMVGHFKVAPGGAPLATRFGAGIKKTELGQYNYLVNEFGEENVSEVYGNDGKSVVGFRWRTAPDQPWRMVDPAPGADRYRDGKDRGKWRSMLDDIPGDIADVAGPMLLEAGPGAVLGAAGGAVGGIPGAIAAGAVGDAAGAVARDAVAERLPGKEADTGQRAGLRDTAINVAAGGVANALPLVGRFVATPARGIAARVAKESAFDPLAHATLRETAEDLADETATGAIRGAAEDAAPEAARVATDAASDAASASARRPVAEIIPERTALSQRTNVDLSAGQLTGSRELLMKEDALSAVGKYANEIGDAQMRRVRQGELHLRKTLGQRPDSLLAGTRGADAYVNYTNQLDEARKLATRPLFAEADQLLGGRGIPTRNFRSVAEALAGKDGAGSGAGTKAIAARAREIVEELEANPNVSASRLSDLLSEWGKAAQGGDLMAFKEADPRRARAASAKLFGALQKDLDDAATLGPSIEGRPRFNSSMQGPYGRPSSGDPQAAASKLREARERFKELSVPIADAKNDLLENMVGLKEARKGDTIGASLLQTRSLNQIRHAIGTLNKADPVAARDLVIDALGSLVDAAKAGTGEANQAGVSVSMARFATSGRANRGKVLALVSGLGDNDETKAIMSMWNDAVRVAEVISDRGLPPGSQTASRFFNAGEEASSVLRDARTGGITGAVAGAVERTINKGPVLNGEKLAAIASDPEARDAFTSLIKQMSTAGGRLSAEAKDPRAYAEAWFRAAVQTGIVSMRDARTGGLTSEQLQEERRRNRPMPVTRPIANEGSYP